MKFVESLKEALRPYNGKVIVGDCDPLAAAIQVADESAEIKSPDSDSYIESVMKACKEIDAIIPIIEEEVPQLASHEEEFSKMGVRIIASPIELVDICMDKLKTYEYIRDLGYPGVPTFSTVDEMIALLDEGYFDYPLIVKPAEGKASQGVHQVNDEAELRDWVKDIEDPIIQPHLKDKEYSIDAYLDLISGELIDVVMKEKLSMANGASDKTVSTTNEELESLITAFLRDSNFKGPIDIDCFEYKGKYYISEINPRFGASYIYAHELGHNFMTYIVNNMRGEENEPYKGIDYDDGVHMYKYEEVLIQDKNA